MRVFCQLHIIQNLISGKSVHYILPYLCVIFSDDDFVPKLITTQPKNVLHPVLGSRLFPVMEETLASIENLPSKSRQKSIASLTRKVIKAVQPGVRGKCVNQWWSKSIGLENLKTHTARAIVGVRASFSLQDFLPWTKMNLKNFNSGPNMDDYLIPVKSWESFQVILSSMFGKG